MTWLKDNCTALHFFIKFTNVSDDFSLFVRTFYWNNYCFAACCCLSVPGYLGCFNNNNDKNVLPDKHLQNDSMTIEKCLQFCRNHTDPKMRFAGVYSRTLCSCGANNTKYDKHGIVEDWKCDQQCAGNSDDICGGFQEISIYDCESTINVKYEYEMVWWYVI